MSSTTVSALLLGKDITQEHVVSHAALSVATNYTALKSNSSVTDETTAVGNQTSSVDPLISVNNSPKTLSNFLQNITESTSTIVNHLTTTNMDKHGVNNEYTNINDVITTDDTTTQILDTTNPSKDSYVTNALFWILIGMVIIALLGNVVTCVLVRCDVRLHHMTYYFVTSLSVLNILMSLTVMPLAIPVTMQGRFTHSVGMCKLWISMDLFLCNNACLHLAFAIMDAYLRLKEPLRHRGRGSPVTCSRITWLLSPWLISLVQASAQFMLSESDYPIVNQGLCFIYNNNFLIVGAIFSYAIPNAITVAFYSLCYKEIKALKAGRYFDENGSLRRQYTQQESDDNSQTDDDMCDADVINNCDDDIENVPSTPELVPEIVQMSLVSIHRHSNGQSSTSNCEADFNHVTSFSNENALNEDYANGHAPKCHSTAYEKSTNEGHINSAYTNSTTDIHADNHTDQHQTEISCSLLLDTNSQVITTKNNPKAQQTDDIKVEHVVMNQECPDECLRHELELSRLLFMLMLSICLSWLPLSVGQFVYAVCPVCVERLSMTELLCLKWVGYACACWAPFIHVKCSEYVRSAVKQLFTCQYCR